MAITATNAEVCAIRIDFENWARIEEFDLSKIAGTYINTNTQLIWVGFMVARVLALLTKGE